MGSLKTLPRAFTAPPMFRNVEAEVHVGTSVAGKAAETEVEVKERVVVGVEIEVEEGEEKK